MTLVRLFEEAIGLDRFQLGGKGYGLVEMCSIGLPVPPGMIITTDACKEYYAQGRQVPSGLFDELQQKLKQLENKTERHLGNPNNPLFLSVRSGAPYSMPGMMDTILNLGLNDDTAETLAKKTGNERFALDAHRRFIQMFGKIALGVSGQKFEDVLENHKKRLGVKQDVELNPSELRNIIKAFRDLIKRDTGKELPGDPWNQLEMAVEAVFGSWNNPRAVEYRRYYKIADDLGTAVTLQQMVFGNTGENSGSGVGFTRNPSTGDKRLYGEYLRNSQGEDVVAGIRTPDSLDSTPADLRQELAGVSEKLEQHFKEMQDFEFTVENGKLYLLQTRNGKRTAQAAVKIAVDMVEEKLITKQEALVRINPGEIDQLLHRTIDPKAHVKAIAKGLNASPGAASGIAVFDTDEAAKLGAKGEKVILVRPETTPEDIRGIIRAQGILTVRGGMTCVAAKSWILTDSGFMTARDLFSAIEGGLRPSIICFDYSTGRAVWRRVIAAGTRVSDAIEAAVSQTGRSSVSTLGITPDHRMLTLEDRKLVKKPLQEIVNDKGFVCLIDKIPGIGSNDLHELAYLVGALFTDGYVNLKRTKGSVTFTQKPIPAKEDFIRSVRMYFENTFGSRFNIERIKTSNGTFEGRVISGTALDLICTTREPAARLSTIWDALDAWVMSLDEASVLSFIAGAADGDGTPSGNRIQIFNSDSKFVQALVIACLRVGTVPQVTTNRGIYNVQLTERLEDIFKYSHRIKGQVHPRYYGTKLFSARSLAFDLPRGRENHRIRDSSRRNLLMDGKKVLRYVASSLPLEIGQEIVRIVSSDLRMCRVKMRRKLAHTRVYNFEVDAREELDRNFVVFTDSFLPVLVSNSHAAVVARGMGKAAVVGCSSIKLDLDNGYFKTSEGLVVKRGELITVDGSTGEVLLGDVPTIEPQLTSEFQTVLDWADDSRRLGVRANADTPEATEKAREFGAEGIGLCRTERMFNAPDRLPIVREMIMAEDESHRKDALRRLVPFQLSDFKSIFRLMVGKPVTVRLLDLPLHEFLPSAEEIVEEIENLRIKHASASSLESEARLLAKVHQLSEHNPMLGHRGCRLAVTYPEIYEAQTDAIIRAAIEIRREVGQTVKVQIMLPLISNANEMVFLRGHVEAAAERVFNEMEERLDYKVGTMIETPRAALTAAELAKYADFFSFGTNDLTQTTYAFSRDDAEAKFMARYLENKILTDSPFEVLDAQGVGRLVNIGYQEGRKSNPKLEVGICGEHGGEPRSVSFFHNAGLDYVSCSAYRIPVARIAAAQAAIATTKSTGTV